MDFVRLGLKIIPATFVSDLTHFVGVGEKESFFMNSKWRPHQFGCYHKLSCVTHDVPRYHETKESPNKGKLINSYWPKHIFASCGHAQFSHDISFFAHPQMRVPSHHTKFGVDFSKIC